MCAKLGPKDSHQQNCTQCKEIEAMPNFYPVTVYALHQNDQCKFTGAKAAYRTAIKSTPEDNFTNILSAAFAPTVLRL